MGVFLCLIHPGNKTFLNGRSQQGLKVLAAGQGDTTQNQNINPRNHFGRPLLILYSQTEILDVHLRPAVTRLR